MSPHLAQLGKLEPTRLHVVHTLCTRNRDVRSRSWSVGGSSCCVRGVEGASDDDAVSSESIDGVRLEERSCLEVEECVRECSSCSVPLETARARKEGTGEREEEEGECLEEAELESDARRVEDGPGKLRVGAREGRSSTGMLLMQERRVSRADER